jgi:hypothetical protein
MLEILSLVACGWLLMYNPSANWKRPIAEVSEQLTAWDSASDCEANLDRLYTRAKEANREWKGDNYRCVPADSIYPHAQPKK